MELVGVSSNRSGVLMAWLQKLFVRQTANSAAKVQVPASSKQLSVPGRLPGKRSQNWFCRFRHGIPRFPSVGSTRFQVKVPRG